MDKDNKFFCIEPYVGLSIIVPNHAFCCCLHEGEKITNTEDIWNDPYLKSIRAKFDNNEIPKECKPCIEQEKHTDGRSSRRLDSNKNWETHVGKFENYLDNDAPYKLDFWTGNICNLACATCAADDSSLWGTLQKRKPDTTVFHRKKNPNNFVYKKEDVPNINYKNLRTIHFNGGEPFLTDTHLKVLNKIPEQQRANVHVQYNTNGTILIDINDEKYQIFKQFLSVDLCYSLDGIEETFEYTRWPAKWDKVKNNIDFWVEQVHASNNESWHLEISFNIVKSVYNYNKIDETINYIDNRWCVPINKKRKNHPEYHPVSVHLCNDHAMMDYTDEDFANYRLTSRYNSEITQIKDFRKR